MKIPKIILDEAEKYGYNSVGFIGVRDGAQAFSVGYVDDNGFPPPTGLPTVFLLKGTKVIVKSGLEALHLL
ncbi:MAG: hypothetical protein Q4E59_03045 [Bacteroidales bacterium]|nr:hypothetical protein [Bacteroidales bacterium]